MAVLRSPYLAANARLREAASGGRPLLQGETSVGVAQLQAALSDLGYSLPRSIGPSQAVDGFFGAETVTAVTAFQKDRKLPPTGSADAQSLASADAALATALPMTPQPRRHRTGSTVGKAQPVGRRAPPIAHPAPFGIYFEDPNYMTGTGDPAIAPDDGAGVWNSRRRTFSAVALKAAIVTGLGPVTDAAIGRNATRHMRHYFGNTGLDLAIDLENMVRIVPSARQALVLEFRQVQRFLKDLPIGRYDFTSRAEQGGYNQQGENTDWYFAIGGYALWGKGRAQITGAGALRRYDVDFTYRVADRYNWDGGKEVEIGGVTITDEFMGEFHRQGLAREYNCHGSLRRRFAWVGEIAVPPDDMIVRGGR